MRSRSPFSNSPRAITGWLRVARAAHAGAQSDGDVCLVGAYGEQGALSEQPVGGVLLRPGDDHVEELEQSLPRLRLRQVGARTALDQRLERTLVHDLRVDALREVPDRRERPVLRASADDRLRGGVAD